MVKFREVTTTLKKQYKQDLHSTMVKFRVEPKGRDVQCVDYLHSTMVKFRGVTFLCLEASMS